MKAFLVSLALIVVISIGASFYLDTVPMSAEDLYSSDSVRLD